MLRNIYYCFTVMMVLCLCGLSSCDSLSDLFEEKTEEPQSECSVNYTLLAADGAVTPYTPISVAETSEAYLMELAMADAHHQYWICVSKKEAGQCYLVGVNDDGITLAPYNILDGSFGDRFFTFCKKDGDWYMSTCSYDSNDGQMTVEQIENVMDEHGSRNMVQHVASRPNDNMGWAREKMTNLLSDFAEKLSTYADALEVTPLTRPAAFPLRVITSCVVPIAKLHLYEYSEDAAIDGAYDYSWNQMTSYIQKKLAHGEEAMEQYITILTYTYKYGYDKATTIEDMREALNETPKDVVLAFSRNLPSFMQYGQEATSQVINGIVDVDVSVSSVELRQATLSAKVKNFDINSFSTIIEAGYMVKGDGQEKKYTADFNRSSTSLPSTKVSGLKPATDYEAYAYIRTSLTTYKSQIATFTTKESDTEVPEPTEGLAIDMGLSVKWASYNVGAHSPEQYGNYYAWGSTEPQTWYNWDGYEYRDPKAYSNSEHYYFFLGANIAGTQYDVAHVKWGGKWVMPTKAQIDELYHNTQIESFIYKGVQGTLFISKINGNSIFFPNAGYKWHKRYETNPNAGINGLEKINYIWSSECVMPAYNEAYMGHSSGYGNNVFVPETGRSDRQQGLSVRPVCP